MVDDVYLRHNAGEYEILVLVGEDGLDGDNHNFDVEVRFADGSRHTATFFTLRNIQLLMDRHKETGECASGLYFYTTDMIIVEKLTLAAIVETVRDLIAEGDFRFAFDRIPQSDYGEEVPADEGSGAPSG
ncbi:MAG: hypothetical protein LC772_11075 [Chloroflexi bacterium]|nr:hypothetical protein [Chloroflexota bacterium]